MAFPSMLNLYHDMPTWQKTPEVFSLENVEPSLTAAELFAR